MAGLFQNHYERAVRLLANKLRLGKRGAWREVTEAVDGICFVASFVGCSEDALEKDKSIRLSEAEMLRWAANMDKHVDDAFEAAARSKQDVRRGWKNAKFCRLGLKKPTPADYKKWRAEQEHLGDVDEDDPLVSYEYFTSPQRVRPGIRDSEAAKRRVCYTGKDKHIAEMEGEGDSCKKPSV